MNASTKVATLPFRGKQVLITAGPTWVAIDSVRVISNIACGETGVALANRLSELGAQVTLLLGPVGSVCIHQGLKLARFSFYNELRDKVTKLLHERSFDIIIHSAAVSDFKPKFPRKGKIRSDKNMRLLLSPLPKIIARIAQLKKKATLVIFKLESGLSDNRLLLRAYNSLQKVGADLVVANQLNPYRAFILNARGARVTKKLRSKQQLVKKLITALSIPGVK